MVSADQTSFPKPLKQSGALEQFTYEDTTPVIGREFFNVNIVDDLLNAPNADQLIQDLAITSMLSLYLTIVDSISDSYGSLGTRRCLLPQARQPYQCPTEATEP